MKIEVPHGKESEKYIKDTFAMYTYSDERVPNHINGLCIIHMYPKEDTMINGSDELTGYTDAYSCDVRIYDVKNRICYNADYTDAIDIDVPCKVKVFKDLSTMIEIRGGVDIVNGHAMSIYKRGDFYENCI